VAQFQGARSVQLGVNSGGHGVYADNHCQDAQGTDQHEFALDDQACLIDPEFLQSRRHDDALYFSGSGWNASNEPFEVDVHGVTADNR
jgi:hypothetical protein